MDEDDGVLAVIPAVCSFPILYRRPPMHARHGPLVVPASSRWQANAACHFPEESDVNVMTPRRSSGIICFAESLSVLLMQCRSMWVAGKLRACKICFDVMASQIRLSYPETGGSQEQLVPDGSEKGIWGRRVALACPW
jgi:hypothetical protein